MAKATAIPLLLISFILTTLLSAQVRAQSNCTNELTSLSSCLNFITGTPTTAPTTPCCTALSALISSTPTCLCQIIDTDPSSPLANLAINRTLALALPSACKLTSPSLSTCSKSTRPAAAPAGSSNKTETPPTHSSWGGRSQPVGFVVGSAFFFLFFFLVVGPF